ncbi:MAG: hypothetical protein ACTJG1_01120 [Enterococcus gilvus]
MKKWVGFIMLLGILAGCGSGGGKEAAESKENKESTSTTTTTTTTTKVAPKESSAEKKVELKNVDFQVEGTPYTMKIVEKWQVETENEEFALDAEDENTSDSVMVYGLKKADVDGFEVFKTVMKEQITSTEEFKVKEGSTEESEYQTIHYQGYQYHFTDQSEGFNIRVRYYFLETETEYIVINFIAFPSFFDKNEKMITEIMNSFVAGSNGGAALTEL